jgi:hypothetical protein
MVITFLCQPLYPLGDVYQINHQNIPPTEGWTTERKGPTSFVLVHRGPYPDIHELGVIQGFAERFRPEGARAVRVKFDPEKPRREKAKDPVIILVEW